MNVAEIRQWRPDIADILEGTVDIRAEIRKHVDGTLSGVADMDLLSTGIRAGGLPWRKTIGSPGSFRVEID